MSVYITLVEAKAQCVVDYSDDDILIQYYCDLVEELVLTDIQGQHPIAIEGTVSTDETTTINGLATNFLDYVPGDIIRVAGETPRVIESISSDIEMIVTGAMLATAGGLSYVVYTGYPALNTVLPKGLKQAMLFLVSHFYKIRDIYTIGVSVNENSLTYKYLIAPYKNWTIR